MVLKAKFDARSKEVFDRLTPFQIMKVAFVRADPRDAVFVGVETNYKGEEFVDFVLERVSADCVCGVGFYPGDERFPSIREDGVLQFPLHTTIGYFYLDGDYLDGKIYKKYDDALRRAGL